MSSRVLFKKVSVPSLFHEVKHSTKDDIRTDFILENIFSHLLLKIYKFDAISAMNLKEKKIISYMKEILDVFSESYADPLNQLINEIHANSVNEERIDSILLGISNELFSEGITYSRIIVFFAFVGEFTKMIILNPKPTSYVDITFECCSRLFKERLESWVEDHGGWMEFENLELVPKRENSFKMKNINWIKQLLYSTIQIFGIYCSVLNSLNNYSIFLL